LYKDKVAGCSRNGKVVPIEHSSRIKPPDRISCGVIGMIAPAPLDRLGADVGRALEFESAPAVQLKVSEGATE